MFHSGQIYVYIYICIENYYIYIILQKYLKGLSSVNTGPQDQTPCYVLLCTATGIPHQSKISFE